MPYESFGAIAAKLCKLNDIPPIKFRKFLDDFLGEYNWSRDGFAPPVMRRVSRLLGEKISTVKTLNAADLCLPACYGKFSFSGSIAQPLEYVSYCPDCIRIGYHALFHEFAWLRKCPIHQADLIRKDVPFSIRSSQLDNYTVTLLEILSNSTPQWLSYDRGQAVEKILDSGNFRSFLKWIGAARHHASQMESANIFSGGGAGYSLQDIEVLLGRLAWAIPFPDAVAKLIGANVPRVHPDIVNLSAGTVDRFLSLLSIIDFESLDWFCRKTAALTNDMPKFRSQAMDIAEELKSLHGECHCKWGWSRYEKWLPAAPGSCWPHWGFKCPFEMAIDELLGDWVDFEQPNASSQELGHDRDRYIRLTRVLMEQRYVSPIDPELNSPIWMLERLSSGEHNLQLNLDSDIRQLIEDLLCDGLFLYIEGIRLWLDSIEEGAPPTHRTKLPANSNLFGHADGPYLMRWLACSNAPERSPASGAVSTEPNP